MRHQIKEKKFLAKHISGIYAYGFERPSAIQQRAIMPVINGDLCFYMEQFDGYLILTLQGPTSLRRHSLVLEKQQRSQSLFCKRSTLISKLVKR